MQDGVANNWAFLNLHSQVLLGISLSQKQDMCCSNQYILPFVFAIPSVLVPRTEMGWADRTRA